MIWDFHGITVAGHSNNASLQAKWVEAFASRPAGSHPPDITLSLDIAPQLPAAPDRKPDFQAENYIDYYLGDRQIKAVLPNLGQLNFDLEGAATTGNFSTAILHEYGALEDVLSIALAPHLRRRGYFLVHAFAASLEGNGVLIAGDMGAGKTTTGLALLNDGWQLLSNDSPLLTASGLASYPGVLAAFPDSFGRFPALREVGERPVASRGRAKISVAAEELWPGVWLDSAPLKMILFPQIEDRPAHRLESLGPAETLRLLLPHTVEQWDRAMMPRHLALLKVLVSQANGYRLHLARDVLTIPGLLRQALLER